MRNPERINNFCNQLAKFWEQHPDLRFGQVVELLKKYNRDRCGNPDIFYVEDFTILQMIDDSMNLTDEDNSSKEEKRDRFFIDPAWYFDNFIKKD